MFILDFDPYFRKKSEKILRKRLDLSRNFRKALNDLSENPRKKSLKTHKVIAKRDGREAFSSFVSGDLRILWRFRDGGVEVIDLFDVGGHEGKDGVYL